MAIIIAVAIAMNIDEYTSNNNTIHKTSAILIAMSIAMFIKENKSNSNTLNQ